MYIYILYFHLDESNAACKNDNNQHDSFSFFLNFSMFRPVGSGWLIGNYLFISVKNRRSAIILTRNSRVPQDLQRWQTGPVLFDVAHPKPSNSDTSDATTTDVTWQRMRPRSSRHQPSKYETRSTPLFTAAVSDYGATQFTKNSLKSIFSRKIWLEIRREFRGRKKL